MKVLFGTDIMLSYLTKRDYYEGVNLLVDWIDRVGDEKCYDFSSLMILSHFIPNSAIRVLNDFSLIKQVNKASEPISKAIKHYCHSQYMTQRAMAGMKTYALHLELLRKNEVDFIVTEVPEFFELAKQLGYDDLVYHIETFIEKYSAEHRELDECKGVVVKQCLMGDLSLEDSFFDSFKKDYEPQYTPWFMSKQKDPVFVSTSKNNQIKAILKLKIEDENENYSFIRPSFVPKKRLKISSLKVDYTGQKLGERFVRIAIEKAINLKVDEIYGTIYKNSNFRLRLVNLMKTWGFKEWGRKGDECVLVRDLKSDLTGNLRKDFPFHQYSGYTYIVPLPENYFDQLFPSVDARYCLMDYEPRKSAIRKVVVLKDIAKLPYGTILLFYKLTSRVSERGIGAVGVVENTHGNFRSFLAFKNRCRKHSVLPDSQLLTCWERMNGNVASVDFLFIQSFNVEEFGVQRMEDIGINTNEMYAQRLYPLSKDQFFKIIKGTSYESRIVLY